MCQFTDDSGRATLANFIDMPRVYAAGRLDYDSEGLILLTGDGRLQQQISDPRFKMPKTYWVQVEGEISDEALNQLQRGVALKDGPTKPAKARRLIDSPPLWDRNPPVRFRANIPTSWIELEISEGRNRQVRRMTAAVGFPTLRLVRAAIGEWQLADLQPGEHRSETLAADHPLMKAQRNRRKPPYRKPHGKQQKPGSTRRNTRS